MQAAGMPYEEAERAGRPLSAERIAEIIRKDQTRPMEENAWCEWFIVSQDSIDGGPCGKCKYYDERPKLCQDYEKGEAGCLETRRLLGFSNG